MVTSLVAPPIQVHEKIFVWKYKSLIRRPATGLHLSFVNPMLYVPDVLKLFLAIFGVVNGYRRLKKGLSYKKRYG